MAGLKPLAPCASQRRAPTALSNLKTLPSIPSLVAEAREPCGLGLPWYVPPASWMLMFLNTPRPLPGLPDQIKLAWAVPQTMARQREAVVLINFNDFIL